MFSKSTRVLIKDGTFNNVQGEYHHYDYSQHTTNNGSYNVIGNTFQNVHNSGQQSIYHGPNGHFHSANDPVVPADVGIMNNHARTESAEYIHNTSPQHQAPGLGHNSPTPLLFSSSFPMNARFPGQFPGQFVDAQPGDIRPMTAVEKDFMNHQMAQMLEEMNSEFGVDNEDQEALMGPDMYNDDTSEESEPARTRSQSLSADFNRLTIDERIFQPSAQSLTADLQHMTIHEHVSQQCAHSNQAECYTELPMLGQRMRDLTSMASDLSRGITGGQAPLGVSPTRSVPVHVSSSPNTSMANDDPIHVIIRGDHTEVDNSVHEFNFKSHIVANNIIEDSYKQREEEGVIEQKSNIRKLKQAFMPKRR